ncbi:hypothetical protein [Acidithiobacillus sp.]|uniref:hypothetical protein n=1 Tax=Acidithiobacillus sp. TaxID=1872118 RepID=UPI003D01D52B
MATSQQTRIVTLAVQLALSPMPSQYQQSEALVSLGGSTLAVGSYQFCATNTAVTNILSTTGNYAELTNMAGTFFDQGSAAGVYVLELGVQATPQDGIAALQAYKNANSNMFYAYLVPDEFDTPPAPATTSVAVTADSTSTLPAGTYYTQIAYINGSGTIGQLSPVETSTVSTADADELVVTSPAAITGATSYLVYMGTVEGTLYLQNGSSGTAIGTSYSQAAPIETTTGTSVTLADLGNDYSSANGMCFLLVNSTPTNMAAYGTIDAANEFVGYKAIIAVAPSPSAQSGEFTAAAWLYNIAVNNPGANSKLAPMQYRYLYGVTPWPATGYSADIQNIVNYGGNYVGTGAEGGISAACIRGGTTSSLAQISAWYGLDWEMINIQQVTAAEIINGSNTNPPLEYDQDGINLLEEVAQVEADNGVTFGCALSAVISAIPFYTYNQQNPGDYSLGDYNGLTGEIVAQNGFLHIIFNIALSFNAP